MSDTESTIGALPSAANVRASLWLALGYVSLLVGLSTLVFVDWVGRDAWWAHGTWCLVMVGVIAAYLVAAARKGIGVVLTDHRFVFATAFLVYFVVGAGMFAFPAIAPAARVAVGYPIDARDVLFVDAANSIGFAVALVFSAMTPVRGITRLVDGFAREIQHLPTGFVVGGFIAVGAVGSIVVGLTDLGIGAPVVSGAWRALSALAVVAVFLGFSYRGRGAKLAAFAAVLTALMKSGMGLLLFNKTEMLLPIGAIFLGLASRKASWKPLLAGALIIVAAFSTLGSLATFGRSSLSALQDAGSIMVRAEVLTRGLSGGIDSGPAASYSGWDRICYVPEQHAARVLYDSGQGGDDFKLLPWVLVPRVLAPSKPVMTRAGSTFYRRVSGNPFGVSATSPGILMGGYYNGGWWGLILVGAASGWVLALTSAVATAAIRQRSAALLPVAFLGAMTAFRIDGHFVTDYLGGVTYIMFVVVVLGGAWLGVSRRKVGSTSDGQV